MFYKSTILECLLCNVIQFPPQNAYQSKGPPVASSKGYLLQHLRIQESSPFSASPVYQSFKALTEIARHCQGVIKNLRFSFQTFDSLHQESVNFTHQNKAYNNSNFNGFSSPKFHSIEEKTSKSDKYFGIDFMQKDRDSRLKFKSKNSEFDEIVKNSATTWQEYCVDKHTKYGFISYKNQNFFDCSKGSFTNYVYSSWNLLF